MTKIPSHVHYKIENFKMGEHSVVTQVWVPQGVLALIAMKGKDRQELKSRLDLQKHIFIDQTLEMYSKEEIQKLIKMLNSLSVEKIH